MTLMQAKCLQFIVIPIVKEILILPFYSPSAPAEIDTILCHVHLKNPVCHKPGLKNESLLSLSSFSTLQALIRHNSAILARRLKLWLPFCLS